MKKAIGSEVWVYLRSSANTVGDIFGLLVDVDDDSLYIQSFDTNNQIAYIIPRDNVKYCTTSVLPSANLAIDPGEPKSQQDATSHIIQQAKQEEPKPDHIDVFVNKALVANIPVPPTFNLDVWNESIMRVIMGNPDMRAMLANRIQKSLEYWPGEVYIELTEEEPQELQPEIEEPVGNSFSMTDGGQKDITTKFVNPSQMITRLNAAVTRGKKHGETKV